MRSVQTGALRHLPENIGDMLFEVILFERKLAEVPQGRGLARLRGYPNATPYLSDLVGWSVTCRSEL